MGGNARSISEDWHINENVLIVSKAYSKGRSPFSDFCFLLPASFLTVNVNRKGIQKSRPASSFFRGKIWDQQTSLKSHFLSQKSGSYQCFFSLFAIYCSEERRVGKPNQPQKNQETRHFALQTQRQPTGRGLPEFHDNVLWIFSYQVALTISLGHTVHTPLSRSLLWRLAR